MLHPVSSDLFLTSPTLSAAAKKPKKEPEPEIPVWKWWLEEKLPEGIKWRTLSHSGPAFPELYERLPVNVHFKYDGMCENRLHDVGEPSRERRQRKKTEKHGEGEKFDKFSS